MAVANVKEPLVATARLSPPLFWRTSPVPDRPTAFPPTEAVPVVQVTCTVVTFAEAVPLPLVTVQVCAGPVGCVSTVTAYFAPLAREVLNVNEPLAEIERLSPPLSWRTSPVPDRPEIVPPMVKVADAGVPVPEPEVFGMPLQAVRRSDVISRDKTQQGLIADFITIWLLGGSKF